MNAPEPPPCLLGLRLSDRRVVVAGGGGVAARRVPVLLDAGAEVIVVAPVVVSAHVPPGDPRSTVNWPALGASRATLVLLMAVENLAAIASTLIRNGRNPNTPVSVIVEGTLPSQYIMATRLGGVAHEVKTAGLRPPAIIVVGDVVDVAAEIAGLTMGQGRQSRDGMTFPAGDPAATGPVAAGGRAGNTTVTRGSLDGYTSARAE